MSMLVIRQAQIHVLQQAIEHEFVVQKARWAVMRCGLSDSPDLQRRIDRAAKRALQHRLIREGDVHVFVELDLLYGEDFDTRYATVAEILARDKIDGARKAKLLEDWELFERPEVELQAGN